MGCEGHMSFLNKWKLQCQQLATSSWLLAKGAYMGTPNISGYCWGCWLLSTNWQWGLIAVDNDNLMMEAN